MTVTLASRLSIAATALAAVLVSWHPVLSQTLA